MSRSGPWPNGLNAIGITAQARAGPQQSRIDAVKGKPAKSQPTPGKPIRPSGSSYAARAAGLRRRTRFGILPV